MDGFFNGHDVTGSYDTDDRGPSFRGEADPLFYHKYVTGVILKNSSRKSYKVSLYCSGPGYKDAMVTVWLPKSICRKVVWGEDNVGSMYVHRDILNSIIEKELPN